MPNSQRYPNSHKFLYCFVERNSEITIENKQFFEENFFNKQVNLNPAKLEL